MAEVPSENVIVRRDGGVHIIRPGLDSAALPRLIGWVHKARPGRPWRAVRDGGRIVAATGTRREAVAALLEYVGYTARPADGEGGDVTRAHLEAVCRLLTREGHMTPYAQHILLTAHDTTTEETR